MPTCSNLGGLVANLQRPCLRQVPKVVGQC